MTEEIKMPFANISHLGWVVRDVDKAIKHFELMGIGPWRQYTMPSPGHDFQERIYLNKTGMKDIYKIALANWGNIVVELFEVVSGGLILKQFLETRGEGIYHFGYVVKQEQFDKVVNEMTKRGFKIIGQSQYKSGVRMAFFDTDKIGGVIFQLHDCPPEYEIQFDTMGLMLPFS